MLGLGELPGVHAGRPDVAGLPRAHDVVQRLHRLLDRRVRVPAVDLVEVDVVGAQPAQRGVDRGQDVLAGQAAVVRAVRHGVEDLGREHVVVAGGKNSPSSAPVTSSDAPSEYMSAVSKKITPASTAARTSGRLASMSSTHSRHADEP